MQYDKPSPGVFFIATMLSLMFLVTILPLYTMGFFSDPSVMPPVVIPFFIMPAIIFILLVHAGYHTEYILNEKSLDLKCGWIIKGSIPYQNISAIKPAKFNSRTLGRGYGQKGYCNRFTNGLVLQVGKDQVFISPSDNDRFLFELQIKIQRAQQTQAG